MKLLISQFLFALMFLESHLAKEIIELEANIYYPQSKFL